MIFLSINDASGGFIGADADILSCFNLNFVVLSPTPPAVLLNKIL